MNGTCTSKCTKELHAWSEQASRMHTQIRQQAKSPKCERTTHPPPPKKKGNTKTRHRKEKKTHTQRGEFQNSNKCVRIRPKARLLTKQKKPRTKGVSGAQRNEMIGKNDGPTKVQAACSDKPHREQRTRNTQDKREFECTG